MISGTCSWLSVWSSSISFSGGDCDTNNNKISIAPKSGTIETCNQRRSVAQAT